MPNPYDEIKRQGGLWTHGNPLNAPDGAMLVADEAEITREDMVTRRRGYTDASNNLPDFRPEQMISIGGVLYLNIGNALWWYDSVSAAWLLKQPSLPYLTAYHATYAINDKLYIATTTAIGVVDLLTGVAVQLAGRWGVTGTSDGTGDAARFTQIFGVWSDGTDIYASDNQGANTTIRKITAAGVVTTPSTATTAATPTRPIVGDSNYIYGGTGNIVRYPILGGAPTTLATIGVNVGDLALRGTTLYAGTTSGIYTASTAGGAATLLSGTAGEFTAGMTLDVSGNLFWVTNGSVLKRRDVGTGAVTTLGTIFGVNAAALAYASDTLIARSLPGGNGSLRRYFISSGQTQAFAVAFVGSLTGKPPYVTALSGIVTGPT